MRRIEDEGVDVRDAVFLLLRMVDKDARGHSLYTTIPSWLVLKMAEWSQAS